MNTRYYRYYMDITFIKHTLILILFLVSATLYGQTKKKLRKIENELISQYQEGISSYYTSSTDSLLIQFENNFLKTLKNKKSFAYPFDSLKKLVSIINSDDNRIKVYSWELPGSGSINYVSPYYSTIIQYKTDGGKVKANFFVIKDTIESGYPLMPDFFKIFSLNQHKEYLLVGAASHFYTIRHIGIDSDSLINYNGFSKIPQYSTHPTLIASNGGLDIYCGNDDKIINIQFNKPEYILSFKEFNNSFENPWDYYMRERLSPFLTYKFSIRPSGEKTRIMLCNISTENNYDSFHCDTLLADKLLNRAKILYSINEKDSAYIYLNRTLKCFKESSLWDKYFKNINIFSKIILDGNETTTAFLLLNQGIQNSIDLFGEQNPYLADLLLIIGDYQFKKGLYQAALDTYLKALKIINTQFGEDAFRTALFDDCIGKTYFRMFEYELAKGYYLKSLQIKERFCDENSPEIIESLHNLGIVYRQNGENEKAINCFKRALDIYTKFHMDQDFKYSSLRIDCGITYKNSSEYDLAKEYIENGYSILTKQVKEDPEVMQYLMYIGEAYEGMGLNNEALKFYTEAISYNEELFAVLNSYHRGNVFKNANYFNLFAKIYSKIGNYDLAFQYLGQIDGYRSDRYDNVEENRNANYGFIYRKLNQIDKSIDQYNSALSFASRDFGNKHPSISNYLNILGDLYFEKNELDLSESYYHKAVIANIISLNDTVFDSFKKITDYYDPLLLLQSLDGEARILQKKYQKSKDLNLLNNNLNTYEICDDLITNIRKSFTSQSDKVTLGEISSRIYENAIKICLALDTLQKSNQKEYLTQALMFSEKNKSNILLEAMEANKALHFSGIPDSLITTESTLRERIFNFRNAIEDNRDSVANLKYQNTLFELNRQYEKLITQLEVNYPSYYDLKYSVEPLNISKLKKKLDEHTAIISYLIGDSNIYAFTLTNNTLRVSIIENTDSILISVNEIQRILKNSYGTKIDENFNKCSYYLFNKLLKQNTLNGIINLIIIPDGQLVNIPFEVFLTEKIDNNIEYKYAPFLIRKYNLSYSYSINLLYKYQFDISDSSENITFANDWLGIAPVFDGIDTTSITLSTKTTLESIDKLISRTALIRNGYISPLPGTEIEIRTIYDDFNKKKTVAKALLFNSATEDVIKTEFKHSNKYVHIATHAWINSENPELSGILLSQSKLSSEDGILYSGEIYNLKINSDLIVLSACETGVGKLIKGEGILGFTRSLLFAGCKNLIVSLWKVEDNSTSKLMIDFYNIILNSKEKLLNYSEPLRRSKLNMIDEGIYSNPFYWAPFILIGN